MSQERITFFFSCVTCTGENQSEIYLNMSINTCCICFFSISVGRKKSQSSVYVNQCSVGGRVMTLVCKNNTSSTRERAFAFASFSLSLYLAHNTSCPQIDQAREYYYYCCCSSSTKVANLIQSYVLCSSFFFFDAVHTNIIMFLNTACHCLC